MNNPLIKHHQKIGFSLIVIAFIIYVLDLFEILSFKNHYDSNTLNYFRFIPAAFFLLCFPFKEDRTIWTKIATIIFALQAYLFTSFDLFEPYSPLILRIVLILILIPNVINLTSIQLSKNQIQLLAVLHGISIFITAVYSVVNFILFMLGMLYGALLSYIILLIIIVLTPLILSPIFLFIQNSKILNSYNTNVFLPCALGVVLAFVTTCYFIVPF